MKKIQVLLLFFYFISFSVFSQKSPAGTADIPLQYYLPAGFTYDEKIPKPKEILGFEVGEWNAGYDQVIRYFEKLADSSPRVKFEIIGYTYEKRPQILLTITSPENLTNLDKIKSERQKLRDPNAKIDFEKMPLVMAAGYSVHGNESSALNSSILAAYHFAAANEIEADLQNIIVLIDPSLNPDGSNRYASWVNSHRSYNLNGDPANRELSEAWPGGRGNHYWFDLNRDWLLVQHPESQNRVAKFQEWLPNIYLDYHEMGTNNTFFFQPGIPSRDHPLTPKKNIELTEKMAKYHAKAMDEIGSLYHSRESFDEYYFGYGSTYPDIQGSIGILFEQASSRGHLQESIYGPLPFAFTVRNQFRTSVSSFAAAKDMRVEINKFMQDFYAEAVNEAAVDTDKAYIFGDTADAARSFHLAEMIQQHQIDVYVLNQDITVNGVPFNKEKSYIVPLNQPQYKLIKVIFETRNTFQDSLFYDVSAWTLPMAFNLDYTALSSRIMNLADVTLLEDDFSLKAGTLFGEKNAYSYAFEWADYYAPKAAYKLMDEGFLVRLTHEPITLPDGKVLGRGSILVSTLRDAGEDAGTKLHASLNAIAAETGITVYGISSGYTAGVNIGSPTIDVLKKPEVALLVGTGITSTEAGEMWHLMDQRFDMPITLLPVERLRNTNLGRYNVLIMPNGNYAAWGKDEAEKIKSWISEGNTLIARGNAMTWLNGNELVSFTFKKDSTEKGKKPDLPYANFTKNTGARMTSGTIFHAKLDVTHPVAYGFGKAEIFTFRNSNQVLEPSKNPYSNPMVYTDKPLASGYVHPANLELVRNSSAIQVKKLGQGRVIGMVDNPNFRAIWYGTNKLFLNAIFFGQVIEGGTAD
ncbi:zinc carboxypeptidase [Aquiflexum sp. TKW24L]|uniref:M14 family zinc carboxypeptidase n=1 Tax=Aquiflexum sp. TKW24L TaxID=2942212 RepID=UPI0020C08CA1|nr:M14 family zinc carboxypeptidase [Aquiflexum sp. TKW24L]MCL6260649.1 zinc carboxypeptidase [Aquiflexum sp. TKW24L]